MKQVTIPGIGRIGDRSGLIAIQATADGLFTAGENGVEALLSTLDRKVELVSFGNRTLAHVRSSLGYPAYYPLHPAAIDKPVRAVLMDLDGTSVHSEEFWMWIIESTVSSLLEDTGFRLKKEDRPYVSGHSVSEHLQYCIRKYCPHRSVEEARVFYFGHARREMDEIARGRGRSDAFVPAPGLRDFLLELKAREVRIALVTSGLYEKAYPAISAAFATMGLGDPKEFYDALITAGFPLTKGQAGTLGELSPKPHPWLYAEAGRVGLGIPFSRRNTVVGIEDSAAGICSIRLAGYPAVGLHGGNIAEGGASALCGHYCRSFEEILRIIL